ncbi:MAG: hypothetical protein EB084_24165 [Proteobacteria bacterium]|nr:hypothetical protein [Pseudomonadota bacterium]
MIVACALAVLAAVNLLALRELKRIGDALELVLSRERAQHKTDVGGELERRLLSELARPWGKKN